MRRQHFITFLGGAAAVYRRDLVIAPAAQQRLPRLHRTWFVAEGGLISYGSDLADLVWCVAGYLDRIPQGEKPADLPVRSRPNSTW